MVIWVASFRYKNVEGYTVLPILNYRVSVLIDPHGGIRVISNIPHESWRQRLEKICLDMALGKLGELGVNHRIDAYAMMYGGLGTFAILNDNVYVMLVDFVNRSKFWFYLEGAKDLGQYESYSLQELALMHMALREGLTNLLKEICGDSKGLDGLICRIRTSHGTLYVSSKPLEERSNMIRVVPDNVPLRHVVSYVGERGINSLRLAESVQSGF